MARIYFKGLAEIRSVAALGVLFHHIELYKYRDDLPSLYHTSLRYFINALGKNGVYIFFVLSGFLITYLLLSEKKVATKINIRKFYFRRILRIWPLYYLIVFISFLVIPVLANTFEAFQNENYYYGLILELQEAPYVPLILFLLFLPNLALALKPAVVGASQAWSVGVEEQFYLIWPIIIDKIKRKSILFVCLIIICLAPIVPILIKPISTFVSVNLSRVINLVPIHYMAIGSVGAFLLFFYKKQLRRVLKKPIFFIVNTFLLLVFLFFDVEMPLKYLAFGSIILFEILFITQENFRWNFRNKYLEKIGDISYGVYMYHPFMMYLCFSFFNSVVPIENVFLYNLATYGSIIIMTLLISQTSFKYYESKFIRLKNKKFTVVKSGKKN